LFSCSVLLSVFILPSVSILLEPSIRLVSIGIQRVCVQLNALDQNTVFKWFFSHQLLILHQTNTVPYQYHCITNESNLFTLKSILTEQAFTNFPFYQRTSQELRDTRYMLTLIGLLGYILTDQVTTIQLGYIRHISNYRIRYITISPLTICILPLLLSSLHD
jgi:hypothetical protein